MKLVPNFNSSRKFSNIQKRMGVTHMQVALRLPKYVPIQNSQIGKSDFKLIQTLDGKKLSLWHDIPLLAGKSETSDLIFNFVSEITRGESWKLEMSKTEEFNPIKHDIKNNELRKVNYHPYTFNYGYFPQTWENPEEMDQLTNLKGDGDPLDVVEIGIFPHQPGEICFVKVIGAVGLIDEGETDWKIIVIDVNDPKAHFINGEADLKKYKIGQIEAIYDFFTNYKTVDGKPKNKFALDGKMLDQESTINLIFNMNKTYQNNLEKLKQSKKDNSE